MNLIYRAMLLAAIIFPLGLVACDSQGPAEKAGEKIDRAAEKAADKIDEASKKLTEPKQERR